MAHLECGCEIHRHHRIPTAAIERPHVLDIDPDAGIIDDDVDPAERVDTTLHDLSRSPSHGEVSGEDLTTATFGFDQFVGGAVVVGDGRDVQVGAGLRHGDGVRLAEASVAAGDDRLLAREREEVQREVTDVSFGHRRCSIVRGGARREAYASRSR